MEKLILKTLSPQLLALFLPTLLIKVGNWFRDKDTNTTGADDVVAKLLVGAATVVATMDDKDEASFKKALRLVRDTINQYLGE